MKIIVHYPKTKENIDALAKKVADVHADYVIEHIRQLACPAEQKVELTKAIQNYHKKS